MPDFWGDVGGYHPPGAGVIGPIGDDQAGGINSGLNYWSDYFHNAAQQPINAAQFNTASQDQARLEQQRVIQALQAQAAGDPNSQAQQQLRNAYAGAQSQQSSLGSTMRGQSAGAAMRSIGRGQQDIARSLPGDQQMLQLQEQQAAQAMLAQLLQQQHQQDIGQANAMAGNTLGNRALEEAIRQFYAQQGLGYSIEQAQIGAERNAGKLGFDLAGKDITNRFLSQGAQAGATALTTGLQAWGNQPKSSQQVIDDAFDNG